MKRPLKPLWAVSAAVALALACPLATSQTIMPLEAAEGGTLWFVELAGMPVADGNSVTAVQAEKAAFRRNASAAGVRITERRSYDTLFNGFVVKVALGERNKLMRIPGVKAIYPVDVVQAPTPEQAAGSALDLAAAVALTGADIAQNVRGLSGRGIKVGIIDTGIDIDHPAFGGSGSNGTTPFPSARVVTGWDFVGDNYNSGGTAEQQVPAPDANPDDCNGHGTHVAGIVGANGGGIKGVAPAVSFGAYRVFGCVGSTSSDIILEALERAHADGMDVVNQSLGAARQWPQYPTAQATSRLVKRGIVMVASIGNNGPGGSSPDAQFAAGAPGVGERVIGVASFDNAQRSFSVNGTPYGYNAATGAPLPPTSGSLPLARTGTPTTVDDGCAVRPAGSLTGQAVLIRRGTCTFFVKASNAQAAGAAAVVLYNNTVGALAPTVAGTPAITIPVVAITAAQGAALDAAIAAGPTTLSWGADYVSYPFGTGGLISGFSSFGLAADLSLKPNLGAPGGGIFSSYPLEQGGATTLSGTSMSSPHVAGAVALILEARPRIKARDMLTRLQNSADPKNWSGAPSLGLLDHAHRQGAGMIDIIGTIDATTVVEPGQIALGESQAGPQTIKIEVENKGYTNVTYDISHVPAVATGPNTQSGASYALSGVYDAAATVAFNRSSVTVRSHDDARFWVTITAPGDAALPDRGLYGGYIVLTPRDGGAVYRVPYAGFKGDYQTTQVLTPTANGFPWLSQLSGGSFFNRPTGGTYTLVGTDIPFFLLHLDHLSRRIKLEAFDAVTGKSWHKVSDDEYVTRNSTPGGFFAFEWSGDTFRGDAEDPKKTFTVPNGTYVVKASVLKALGEPHNPAHWETWTSPVITIARP
jgi:minor extracellular serine protease Vpr